jgi:hypothetical protein
MDICETLNQRSFNFVINHWESAIYGVSSIDKRVSTIADRIFSAFLLIFQVCSAVLLFGCALWIVRKIHSCIHPKDQSTLLPKIDKVGTSALPKPDSPTNVQPTNVTALPIIPVIDEAKLQNEIFQLQSSFRSKIEKAFADKILLQADHDFLALSVAVVNNSSGLEKTELLSILREYVADKKNTIEVCKDLRKWLNTHGAKIVELNLDNLNLKRLSPEIRRFANLTHLSLRNNQLKELPPEIGRLAKLKSITLKDNLLTEVSPLKRLQNLEKICLIQNKLDDNAWSVFQNMSKLRELYLDFNFFTKVPDWINKLQELGVLAVSHNRVTDVPQEITALPKLVICFLQHNNIERIPEQLFRMTSMKAYKLHHNPLKYTF